MKILVTGGSGFLGTNLVEELRKEHSVLSVDLQPPRNPDHRKLWRNCSILDAKALRLIYQEFQPQLVFHLAARTDLHGDSLDDYQANTRGVQNVIDAAVSIGGDIHTIYASSRLVFEIGHKPTSTFDYKPSTAYGQSKVASEEVVLSSASAGGTWTIVRPTSIWGPWFGVPYRDFFDTVRNRKYVNIRGMDPQKSYGFVGNSVYQLIKLATSHRPAVHGKVFWLTDYPALRLSSWAALIAEEFGVGRPITVGFNTLRVVAKAGDLAKRLGYMEPPLTTFRLSNLVTEMSYDTTETENMVGTLPYTLEDGVARTVSWMRSQAASAHL